MRLSCLGIGLIVPSLLLGQGTSTGGSAMKLPASPRSAALGESVVADQSHLASSFVNPASLYGIEAFELSVAHAEWIQEVRSEYLGVCFPASFGTLRFTIAGTSLSGIELRENPGPALGVFTARSVRFGPGIGFQVADGLSAGVDAQYLYEKIFVEEAHGYSFSFGTVYSGFAENISLGLSVNDIGSAGTFRSGANDLPTSLHMGGAWHTGDSEWDLSVYPAVTIFTTDGRHRLQFGSELAYGGILAARAGYQSGLDKRGISAGFGVSLSPVVLDYAYIPFASGFGNAHMASLTFRF